MGGGSASSSLPFKPGSGRGQGAPSGPRWAAECWQWHILLKIPADLPWLPGVCSVGGEGPTAREPQGFYIQALVPKDAGLGPPSGKEDYVSLGLHPVPRGGNWVHPKNNQTCKQLQQANVFFICGPNNLKVQLFSHCPRLLVSPEWGGALGGDLGSSGVTDFQHPRLRSGWAFGRCPLRGHLLPESGKR